MVTAEGVFPKSGNDPLYASEVNSFGTNKLIGHVAQRFVTIQSGTDYQTVGGTVLYSGTPPSIIIDNLIINTSVLNTETTQIVNTRLRFSGADFNEVTSVFNKQSVGGLYEFSINHVVTSGTFSGWGADFNNPFVISVEGQTPVNNQPKVSDLTVTGG